MSGTRLSSTALHSIRSILITCRHASRDPLEISRDCVARTRRYDRSSSPAAAGEPAGLAGALVYNALHRYYRYYPYYMYYDYTDVRATSVEQARHDGFFFLRFPPRASRPSSRRVSVDYLVTLPPYVLISPYSFILLFRLFSSIPRLILLSPHSLSLLLPLLSYLFTLRPRASGRFNVRDFFSPSLVPRPVLLLLLVLLLGFDRLSSLPRLHSCAPRDVRAQQCISCLCNRAPRFTKLRIVFIATSFLYLKLLAQKLILEIFFTAVCFYPARSNNRNNLICRVQLLYSVVKINRDSF